MLNSILRLPSELSISHLPPDLYGGIDTAGFVCKYGRDPSCLTQIVQNSPSRLNT